MLVDTHCHIHDSREYGEHQQAAYEASVNANVAMICVGTDTHSSGEAVQFSKTHALAWPVIGVHPHNAAEGFESIAQLLIDEKQSIIGIGEIGLDYHYHHSSEKAQQRVLEAQMQLAVDNNLPISFHVRDAFDDFWPIFDNFHGIRGVLHSFTDTPQNAEKGLARGLYLGVNGISTFTKDAAQAQFFTAISPANMVLETDAPYLTPKPFRGKMNIPAYVENVAEYHAHARGIPYESLAHTTTANAVALFGVNFSELDRLQPDPVTAD